MNLLRLLPILALALAAGPAESSAPYPDRPVKLVVPFPPGGAADAIARVIAPGLSEELGQPVVVDNRPGASGNIGAEAVARSPADGYTLLLGAVTSHSINHTLERKSLGYDFEKDLAPVSLVASAPYVLVVHPSVPARSLRELVEHAKAKPGQLAYGSSGAGAPQRLAVEMLRLRTGMDLLHVPYKGSGPVVIDLVGGRIALAIESISATLQHIKAGRLRALAVATERRIPALADVPTLAEAGFVDFQVSSTFGVLAPAKTPRAVVERLNRAIGKVVQSIDVRDRILQQGAEGLSTTPEAAALMIRAEIAMWAKVIRDASITVD